MKCLYCDLEINIKSKEAKEVNENYNQPIFCDYACERDYEIDIAELEEE